MKSFKDALRTRDFVLTAELSLTPESDAASITGQAQNLGRCVDAMQVTENQYGQIHMSPFAAAMLLMQEGIDPVLQLSCCNRNRVALIGELLGARALGIKNLLLIHGKKMPDTLEPQPTQVEDIGVDELIATAALIKDDPDLVRTPEFIIGAVVKAHTPKPDWAAPRLHHKIDAGAQFIQTQLCFDLNVLRRFAAHLVSMKLLQRCHVIADIAVLPSAKVARWLRTNLSHVLIPNKIIRRLDQAVDPQKEGIEICAEYLREIAEIPGVSGANIIAIGDPQNAVQAIHASGLGS